MTLRSRRLRSFIRNFPGYKRFGLFVFLPVFYVAGAGLEFVMINWSFGEVNFYRTYKRTQSKLEAERRLSLLMLEREKQAVTS